MPDAKAVKKRLLPGLGPAVQAVTAKDEPGLSKALTVALEAHVGYATKGHLRGLEAALDCVPATALALCASRRGMRVAVPDSFHRVTVSQTVLYPSQGPAASGRPAPFDGTADVLPLPLLVDAAKAGHNSPASAFSGVEVRP